MYKTILESQQVISTHQPGVYPNTHPTIQSLCVCPLRLQPSAVVTDEDCAACDFNRPGKTCLRKMEWVWRGETYAATSSEYFSLKNQLQVKIAVRTHTGSFA